MAAFRAPGFVEGTWSLECVLDKLAAQIGVDPLELRKLNYAHADAMDGRPYSSKGLMECYRRAEPHWERRHEVRARSDEIWKRGMGMASQIWYGGGGPPSYAWVRLGSDGRANVVTAMQDIGTGTRTAMAMIAAEELGLTLDQVEVQVGDSARGPFAVVSGGSSTLPSMGPAVRSAAADAARQVLELAAQRFEREERLLSLKGGQIVSSDGGSWPLAEITGLLDAGQILGKGARGPNPTGMRVLTFGIQLAEVAVDVGTGEVVVEKVVAIHDVGRVINPLGARSQIEGGIIQALGHTFSEVRLDDPATGKILTRTLDSYKIPTIADVPEIVCDLVDEPDEHLTNLGSKGLGEPPIVPTAAAIANAIRDATGADVTSLPITREEILRALRDAEAPQGRSPLQLERPSSPAEAVAALGDGGARASRAAPSSCRCCAKGSSPRRGSWTSPAAVPRGVDGGTIGAGTTLAELEADPQIPAALREACRLAASPQLRNMGTIGGNLLQATRCWYWRLDFPCYLHGGDRCHAKEGQHREHAFFGNERCASAHPSDPAAALLALGARVRTDRRELGIAELYRLPTEDDRATTTLEPGELILEIDVPEAESSVYLKAMDRKRWAFALVGVAAARVGGETRIALSGAAPVPWLLRRDLAKAFGDSRGQGARHLRVHGRRLRLEDQRRQLPPARSRGLPAHGASRALRTDTARGEPGLR